MANAAPAPNPEPKERIDYFAHWKLNPDEIHLINATADFVVWLDKDGDLDWETAEEYDKKFEAEPEAAMIAGILNRVAVLQSYPVEHLMDVQRKNFRIMVGEGLARALDFQGDSAHQMLDKAAEYGSARNQEIAHFWYLSGALAVAAVFTVMLLIGYFGKDFWIKMEGEKIVMLILGSCVGALGALLSVLLRAGKIPLDPSAGRFLHYFEGGARILIGVVSGAVIQVAAYVGVAFSVFAQKGCAGILLIAFVAGFSEQLAHTIIKRVEMNSHPKGKTTT